MGAEKAASRYRRRAPRTDQDRRPFRENPHLQLSAEPCHRSPRRPHAAPTDRSHGRKTSPAGRRPGFTLRSRTPGAGVSRGVTSVEASSAKLGALCVSALDFSRGFESRVRTLETMDVRSALKNGIAQLREAEVP